MSAVTADASARAARRRSIELFVTLVERDLRLRAKRTAFGMVWPLAAPVFLLVLYVYVFRRVFDVPIDDYPAFLFAGLLPWTFLAQSLGKSIQSISRHPDLVRRSRFEYELLPLASVTASGVFFLLTLAGFVVHLAIGRGLVLHLLPVLVLPVVALWLLVGAISVVLSLVDVYNRDLRSVLGNILTVWFFIVPIVYRQEMAPRSMQFLRSIDPMNMIVGQFRAVLYHGRIARPAHVVLMLATCVAVFVVSIVAFRRWSPSLPRDV
jgi:ABC-type polysaccharide/polyol phosphate export permease